MQRNTTAKGLRLRITRVSSYYANGLLLHMKSNNLNAFFFLFFFAQLLSLCRIVPTTDKQKNNKKESVEFTQIKEKKSK